MRNCLITQLKEVINNDTLPKLGEIKIGNVYEENFSKKKLNVTCPAGTKIYSVGGTFSLTDGGVQITEFVVQVPGTTSVFLSNGNYDLHITDKYGITGLTLQTGSGWNTKLNFDISECSYMTNVTTLALSNSEISGDLSSLVGMDSMTALYLGGTNVAGDWAVLHETGNEYSALGLPNSIYGNLEYYPIIGANITNIINQNSKTTGDIASLNIFDWVKSITLNKTKVYGNIESWGNLTSIESMGVAELQDYSRCTGSIENFVSAQVSNGRSSVTEANPINCPWLLHWATFGGSKKNVAGYMYLTWESASKIAIFNGGTGGIAGTTTVYCKGYTQSEAETNWPGKIIIRVDE